MTSRLRENRGRSMPTGSSLTATKWSAVSEHLSMDHRVVLAMHYLLGMTPEEVAVTLQLPRSTVYSRLQAAVKAMRAALEADARTVTRIADRQEVLR